jgi:hypothetical protein
LPVSRESYPGNDGEVDGLVVREDAARGLLNAEGTFDERSFSLVFMQLEFIADDNRQQHALAFIAGLADEVVCANFIGQRMVEEYYLSLLPTGACRELRYDFARQERPFLLGAGSLAASYLLSYLLLRHNVKGSSSGGILQFQ